MEKSEAIKQAKLHEKELNNVKFGGYETMEYINEEIKFNKDNIKGVKEFRENAYRAIDEMYDIFDDVKKYFWKRVHKTVKTKPELDEIKSLEEGYFEVTACDDNFGYCKVSVNEYLDGVFSRLQNEISVEMEKDATCQDDDEEIEVSERELKTLNLKKEKLEREEEVSSAMKAMF